MIRLLPAWKNAAVAIESGRWKVGDLIRRDDLLELMELCEPVDRVTVESYKTWQLAVLSSIEALRDHLLRSCNMCLATVYGQGYRILPPREQTDYAMREGMKELRRDLSKMASRLTHLDRSALTAEQAKQNTDAMARTAAIADALRPVDRLPTNQPKLE